jgi:hypothetical protein
MWKPVELVELYDLINRGDAAMDHPTRRLWNAVRIEPQKWQLHPWGDLGGGFWVVGVIGRQAIWFNDIEWGFNVSRYAAAGELLEYWCDQGDLNDAVLSIQELVDDGSIVGRAGPPQPLPPGRRADT